MTSRAPTNMFIHLHLQIYIDRHRQTQNIQKHVQHIYIYIQLVYIKKIYIYYNKYKKHVSFRFILSFSLVRDIEEIMPSELYLIALLVSFITIFNDPVSFICTKMSHLSSHVMIIHHTSDTVLVDLRRGPSRDDANRTNRKCCDRISNHL